MHTEVLLPINAPAEYADRATLWNAVAKIEKAKNAQLAREIEIAFPVEVTQEQNISLVREYVKQHFVAAGMCADICVHDTGGGNHYPFRGGDFPDIRTERGNINREIEVNTV